ncbi:MDR family MFS transporter [Streptomyces sp. SID11385]|uniref:MDR family MFS transporter n=1 Tax=Streptomyces sp. SID11385 TaxID=2706031 RepID=UPI001944CC44|nr:MDR family MFS transporter [Streptomyces sp. SID11385]
MPDSAPAPAPEAPPPPAGLRWTLLGVMLAMLLGMLDNNIVGTAMPTIVGELGGLAHLSWVVTAYTLATAVSTPVWGKLGDLYGRKRLFLASIGVFLLGSALSGAARSMDQLIAFRAVQGIGAGGLGAGAFALIGALVPPRERGHYQGMTATVMALGTVGGPLLGGVLTGHLGWRWSFYVNLPLGLLALVWVGVRLKLPAVRAKAVRIDYGGIALLTVAIGGVVLAATWAGSTYAWGSWQVLAAFGAGLLALAGFLAVERRAPEPVLPLTLFTANRNFPLAQALVLAAGVVMFCCSLYLPLFQQTVQGASATNSGLLLLPLMAPVALVSNVAGKLMSRTGRYKIFPVLGTALLTLGSVLLATMDTGTPRWLTSCYLVLLGTGLGLLMQMASTIAQNSVGMRDLGAASAASNLSRTLGGSLGVAVAGSLLAAATGDRGASAGTASGVSHIFVLVAAVCAAGFLASLYLKEVPLRGRGPAPRPAKAEPAAPAR